MLEVVKNSGRVYIDGSGGPKWCPTTATRCGAGIAAYSVQKERNEQGKEEVKFNEVGLVASGVKGRQTVPNSETWALSVALDYGIDMDLAVIPDAAYVVKGLQADEQQKEKSKGSSHGNTREEVCTKVEAHSGRISVKRTPAHLIADELVEGDCDVLDYIGNTIADELAGVGAANELQRTIGPQNLETITRIAEGISRRIAIIEARRW